MRFEHLFDHGPSETAFFALTFPFSYSDCQSMLDEYEKTLANDPHIYFHRELLATSLEGRRLDLLTITSKTEQLDTSEDTIPGLFPEGKSRPKRFAKPTVFVTARVHPGETQGSHMMNGLLSFLLNEYGERTQRECRSRSGPAGGGNSAVANAALSKFVFKIIPMLNPDGVSRGFFRLDTRGQNLNRYYTDPSSVWLRKDSTLHV